MINLKDLHFSLNKSAESYMLGPYDTYHLDCLLNPSKHLEAIRNQANRQSLCFTVESAGEKEAIIPCSPPESPEITEAFRHLNESKDIVTALKQIKESGTFTYALIAPAFHGQFSDKVSPGKLRAALKAIGFDGVIEVALFADILTLKEAFEFDRNIREESDFQITSCCCPMWIAMIKKIYNELMPHMPPSVSPMIASGRVIKSLYPDAVTVFIGPCLAKKAEAREADLAGAIDLVLTFREIEQIFKAFEINPEKFYGVEKEHSSYSGRIYAKATGVSEAVKRTLERINPSRSILPVSEAADGVPACKSLISRILNGETTANFFEGMGCTGGCVGGPKSIISAEIGKTHVEGYASSAAYLTPIDNPYIIELLHRIGVDTDEQLLTCDLFTRKF